MSEMDAHSHQSTTRRALLARSAALASGIALGSTGITPAFAQEASPAPTGATPVVAETTPPAVITTTGPVTGISESGVTVYRGIPYAAPPLGDLRWAAPQPATPWTEPLAATEFCPDCMQVLPADDTQTICSEDCLCLNIWRPDAEIMTTALLPVLVWIHGGGYVGGGSSTPLTDGSAFARQGMVVVSFNYRLGRFGFFVPSAVLDNTEGPYGNDGYLDQIAALRWVQANIGAFGGDPNRVTVMGESAGGASIVHLLTSPAVEDGLAQQAVILSGGGREALLDRPMQTHGFGNLSAVQVDNLFAASLGVLGYDADALAELRAKPAADLVDNLDLDKLAKRRLLGGPLPGVPLVDGEIVQGQPQEHFLDGSARLMPIIIGTTAVDVPTHFPPDKLRPLSWFGPDTAAAKEAYGFGNKRILLPSDLIALTLDIGSDLTMHEPAHFIASTMQEAGFDAWVYRFTYTAESTRPDSTGQVHAGEVPFLFDNLAARYGDAVTPADLETANAFNTYIGNFVRNGNPNGAHLPEWPVITPADYDVLDFTLEDGPVFGPDPRAETVALVTAARERHGNANLD